MKLTQEKREAMMKVAGGFLVGLGALWWFGVYGQQGELVTLGEEVLKVRSDAERAARNVNNGPNVEAWLAAARQRLEAEEAGLVPITGNRRNWLLTEVNKVIDSVVAQGGGRCELEEIRPVEPLERTAELLPKFPYTANHFRVRMAAFYADFGRFVAEFENRFPYMRVQGLTVKRPDGVGTFDPAAEATQDSTGAREPQRSDKLSFDFVVVALVKTLTTP